MSKFVLTYSKGRTSIGQQSELVKLGILKKDVSQYTDADIGSIISIPYNDESGKILLNNGCIEFEVVGINHHKDINDESKPTISLMTKNIIRYAAFDAKEPGNPDRERAGYGNNEWSVSNIRQWLNSEGAANEWFTPQHEYDTAPDIINIYNESGAYSGDPGFLTGFSDVIKQHFATIANDKVFLPSYAEMGSSNSYSSDTDDNHLAKRFTDDASRIKSGADGHYLMRTNRPGYTECVYCVHENGFVGQTDAYNGTSGIAPIIVLC